ncbi:MAG: nucleotidyltransferase [Acetatifactor sp.]|nr:nucleotidyltransferase [Acetatifactor sp.]
MKVNGIIAEFNPFHNGHKYLLEEALRQTEADMTIVAMSGNFVQRGAPALLDKHARAEMALKCGADLVLEIPTVYAVSSAEGFATGGVSLLHRLGVVTHLCFGSECGEIDILKNIARILLSEPEEFADALRSNLRQGFSYPIARTQALLQYDPSLSSSRNVLSSPNNILGIEYIKAIDRLSSSLTPVTVRRMGDGYHDRLPGEARCSALTIRHALYAGCDSSFLHAHMPADAADLLTEHLSHTPVKRRNDVSSSLYYKLVSEKESGFDKYLDVSTDLSARICNKLNEFQSFDSFCDLLKTKELTYTRISRCLLHILLNITKEDMSLYRSMDYVPYARVLGFRKKSSQLLGDIKDRSAIPLVTKLADAEKNLTPDAYSMLKQDLMASQLYYGLDACSGDKPPINEYTIPLVII